MKDSTVCPRFERGMQILSQRWNGLIIYRLLTGPQRFCNIQSAFPVSGRLLSERLKDLEKEGIVIRHVYAETPVRIEYELTDKGRALQSTIECIQGWSDDWIEEPRQTDPTAEAVEQTEECEEAAAGLKAE
ncbi:helix-turn-helix domain-containing protein [Saccharibacillus sp. CPCC 101409]|uniref:winged helix-turn-helix transcriptional regulator n=1 Tax=Saccharibacillus sp. CPCC 101409 TaxID=3058041 RepID=UPI002670F70E|nr:helix-turn-helix domain-containing protein [Saccharibacillus sp. CPCC 101409]MDO3411686.1 helix-turn-helix domain-containing protein [Saccharibacillus sp. CPCC 101409]